MGVQLFFIFLIVVILVCYIMVLHGISSKLREIAFQLTRLESIYRYVCAIDSSCDGLKDMMRRLPDELDSSYAKAGKHIDTSFESDIKNIMNYSPSPKKRQEVKRKDGGNN